jgi:hypothetical protein
VDCSAELAEQTPLRIGNWSTSGTRSTVDAPSLVAIESSSSSGLDTRDSPLRRQSQKAVTRNHNRTLETRNDAGSLLGNNKDQLVLCKFATATGQLQPQVSYSHKSATATSQRVAITCAAPHKRGRRGLE